MLTFARLSQQTAEQSALLTVLITALASIVVALVPSLFQIGRWRAEAREALARAKREEAEAKTQDGELKSKLVQAAGQIVDDYMNNQRTQAEAIQRQANELAAMREQMEKERMESGKAIAALTSSFQGQLDPLRSQVATLGGDNTRLMARVVELEGANALMAQKVETLRTTNARLAQELEVNRSDLEQTRAALALAETRAAEATERATRLEKEVAQLRLELQRYELGKGKDSNA